MQFFVAEVNGKTTRLWEPGTTARYTKTMVKFPVPTFLLLQILHHPLRQRLGRSGVLTGVQLTVNHDIGLEEPRLLKLSPQLNDLVLHKETDILRVMAPSTCVHTTAVYTDLKRKTMRFLLRIGKCGNPLSPEDGFSVRIIG